MLSESESHSIVSNSLQPHGLYSLWNSPGQNTGVGSLSLLQGIFPTQGLNPDLFHCKWILYQLSHKGILEWVVFPFSSGSCQPRNRTGVSYIAGRFFTSWATREAWASTRGNIQMSRYQCSLIKNTCLSTTGEGNGNPLQYSCLENPMDGGAWWATVHGSQTVGHDWATSLSLSLNNSCFFSSALPYLLIDLSSQSPCKIDQKMPLSIPWG